MFLHFFLNSEKLAQTKRFGSNVSSFSLYQYHFMGHGVEKRGGLNIDSGVEMGGGLNIDHLYRKSEAINQRYKKSKCSNDPYTPYLQTSTQSCPLHSQLSQIFVELLQTILSQNDYTNSCFPITL